MGTSAKLVPHPNRTRAIMIVHRRLYYIAGFTCKTSTVDRFGAPLTNGIGDSVFNPIITSEAPQMNSPVIMNILDP